MRKEISYLSIATALFLTSSVEAGRRDTRTEVKSDPSQSTFIYNEKPEKVDPDLAHMDSGRNYYLNRNFEEAKDAFIRATMSEQNNASAWYNLGLSYVQLDQYKNAVRSFFTAYRIDEKSNCLFQLCHALLRSGDIHRCIRTTEKLLQNDPENFQAWKVLGKAYQSIGQLSEAKVSFLKAKSISPNDGQTLYFIELLENVVAYKGQLVPKNLNKANTELSNAQVTYTGSVPKSSVLEYSSKLEELRPLLESYDVSKDAPDQIGLRASEIKEMPKPHLQAPQKQQKPEVQLKNLNVEHDDLF